MSVTEPAIDTAAEAGLRYVSDQDRGLTRRRSGKGFAYRDARGHAVRDTATLDRVRALVIPPAWQDVWICADARGHLQASGRDAKGRKQHLYHPKFREAREQAKFEKLAEFAAALPALRSKLEADRRKHGLPREKVLATIVHLLDTTFIRVGNDEYAQKNKSYGLTTLKDQHAKIAGDEIRFVFTGKSGKTWKLSVKDKRVAKVVKATQDLPGQRLFQYLDDDGAPREVTSTDVNAYLRELSGRDITAKDFRTWAGTVLAASALAQCEECTNVTHAKRRVREVINSVSERLGNTPTICRKCYVHPALIEQYLASAYELPSALARAHFSRDEAMTLAFLKALTRKPSAKSKHRPSRSALAKAKTEEHHAPA